MDKATEAIIDDLVNTLPIHIDEEEKKEKESEKINLFAMEEAARTIYEKTQEINRLQKELDAYKSRVKETMAKAKVTNVKTKSFDITTKITADTMIADTAAMKKAGIFDQYSKVKKGYVALTINPL